MTGRRVYNALFPCTGNSARSILAEVQIGHWGKGQFNGYSAGSFPKGTVHRLALEELEHHHLRTAHWGVPDPAALDGTEAEQRKAFRAAYLELENRIKIFTALPIDRLDRLAIKRQVDEIGRLRVVPK
jgi:protein-tyrosine-phosphatase